MRTSESFDFHDLDRAQQEICIQFEREEIPADYQLDYIDSARKVSFTRDDAIPAKENYETGAVVVLNPDVEPDKFVVTLYHEDGKPEQGCLKGFGGSVTCDTYDEAIRATVAAMQYDDTIARQEKSAFEDYIPPESASGDTQPLSEKHHDIVDHIAETWGLPVTPPYHVVRDTGQSHIVAAPLTGRITLEELIGDHNGAFLGIVDNIAVSVHGVDPGSLLLELSPPGGAA